MGSPLSTLLLVPLLLHLQVLLHHLDGPPPDCWCPGCFPLPHAAALRPLLRGWLHLCQPAQPGRQGPVNSIWDNKVQNVIVRRCRRQSWTEAWQMLGSSSGSMAACTG